MTIEDQLRTLAHESIDRVPAVGLEEVFAREVRQRRRAKAVWAAAGVSALLVLVVALIGLRSSSTSIPVSSPIHASTVEGDVRLTLDLDRSTVSVGESVTAHVVVENVGDEPVRFPDQCKSLVSYRISLPEVDTPDPAERGFVTEALVAAASGGFVPDEWLDRLGPRGARDVGCALAYSERQLDPGEVYEENVVWPVLGEDMLTDAGSQTVRIEASVGRGGDPLAPPLAATGTDITVTGHPVDRMTVRTALEAAAADPRLDEWLLRWGRYDHEARITYDRGGDVWIVRASYAGGLDPRTIEVDGDSGAVRAVLQGPLQGPVPP